jgi:hypothetical protein
MRPVLAVLQVTDSFGEVWEPIAGSLDADLRVAGSVAELRLPEGVVGVIVAAGGREELVDPVLAELRAGSGTPVAVVGARSDYRLAVAVLRAEAPHVP